MSQNLSPAAVVIGALRVTCLGQKYVWTFLGLTSTERIKCLVQEHNIGPPVGLEPAISSPALYH